ncbi:Peroxin-3 [Lipomyces japonicus]|uniref:Peroxin-3 n=1 Tax=Lipomyces japonicus TaxID=56871 RepID=UPI0034CE2FFD
MGGFPSFVHRHKRKITAIVGVAAASYYAFSYLKSKITEIQAQLAITRISREHLWRRFEQNQQDASFTAAALLSSLADPIFQELPVEQITHDLQSKRTNSTRPVELTQLLVSDDVSVASNSTLSVIDHSAADTETTRLTKKELWNLLKVASVARVITLIYCTALLVFFTRLQLNLLGRRSYVEAVQSLGDEGNNLEAFQDHDAVSTEVNRQFLTFSWWLLNKGWRNILHSVESSTKIVLERVTPRTELSLEDFNSLIHDIRKRIDDNHGNFLADLLPLIESDEKLVLESNTASVNEFKSSPEVEAQIKPLLVLLLDEAKDLIESPNASSVMRALIDEGFNLLLSNLQLQYYYTIEAEHAVDDRISEVADTKTVKLASILAGITRQSHEIAISNERTNQYLLAMNGTPELAAFSAVIYSNFEWKKAV